MGNWFQEFEKKMLPNRTFILGGASSGKSAWAERLVEKFDRPMTYIATSRVFDAEVARRLEVHQARRDNRWTTIEADIDLPGALRQIGPDGVALIDCATMWLTNLMMDREPIERSQEQLMEALDSCAGAWAIVSNEVGHGIVPKNAMARQFRERQGQLNIALAQQAELAVQVVAGLPLALKGALP
jgi:adenosylcobinamide kinase/adenosylcobinamide-phosphate guanylyltransferase